MAEHVQPYRDPIWDCVTVKPFQIPVRRCCCYQHYAWSHSTYVTAINTVRHCLWEAQRSNNGVTEYAALNLSVKSSTLSQIRRMTVSVRRCCCLPIVFAFLSAKVATVIRIADLPFQFRCRVLLLFVTASWHPRLYHVTVQSEAKFAHAFSIVWFFRMVRQP
jgi:hypothetical protein